MTDMPTGRWLTRDDLYTVQAGGSGEMVATGQLVVYRNLIDPDPLQIRQAEIYANEWLRLRCQDDDFSTPLNPLNRMAHKARGWTYEPGLERIFHNPDFPAEKAWRVHNANWIAPFYYLLSELPDRSLTMRPSGTYLDWAYRTMRWQLGTEPRMSADQSYFIPRVVEKLRSTGRHEAASDLDGLWQGFVTRIGVEAQRLAAIDISFDDSMFYCSAIPLLLESKVDEARSFLPSYRYNVGISIRPEGPDRIPLLGRLPDGSSVPDDAVPDASAFLVHHRLLSARATVRGDPRRSDPEARIPGDHGLLRALQLRVPLEHVGGDAPGPGTPLLPPVA